MTGKTLERWKASGISRALYLSWKTGTAYMSMAAAWPWIQDAERPERRLRRLIGETLGIGAERIGLSTRIMEDLGADSLEVVELLTAVEMKFGIEVPDSVIERVLTVQDLLHYASRRP